MRILNIVGCKNWAIDHLVYPLTQISKDIKVVYHFTIGKPKSTEYNKTESTHFSLPKIKGYDIYHFHSGAAARMCFKNKKILDIMKGKKVFFTLHNERDVDEILKWWYEGAFMRVDAFISPTKYVYNRFKDFFAQHKGSASVHYIPYAIEVEKFPYTEYYPKSDYVGYNGRVVEHKRLKRLAMASKRAGYDVWGTGYIEDSSYWRSIMKMDNVRMFILIEQKDMVDQMSTYRILANISRPYIETGTLSILEACALGIPNLVTPIGWAKDHLKHEESAYFVKEDDIGELHKHITFLMANAKLREKIRKNARKIIEKYDMDWYLKEHIKIYRRLK